MRLPWEERREFFQDTRRARYLARVAGKAADLIVAMSLWHIPGAAGVLAALFYILMCDGFPGGRSLGKWLTGLKVVRIDRVPARHIESEKLWNSILGRARSHDGIILSDYGYGTVNPDLAARIAASAKLRGTPVVVDSRFRMGEYHGVTSITPNITELEAATASSIGTDAELLRRTGRKVLLRQKLGCLLVTQGRYGMSLFRPRGPVVHIPIYGTDEVADVTGAGDTVIAVFTLALACGADFEDAARLANYAGGVVVMKRGTATVSRSELAAAIAHDFSKGTGRAERKRL